MCGAPGIGEMRMETAVTAVRRVMGGDCSQKDIDDRSMVQDQRRGGQN